MRIENCRQSDLLNFVETNYDAVSASNGQAAWYEYAQSLTGVQGTRYEIEDAYLDYNNAVGGTLHDKWGDFLKTKGFPGNMVGMRQYLSGIDETLLGIDLSADNVAVMNGSPRYILDQSPNKKHFQFGSNRPVCILPSPNGSNGLYHPGVSGQDATVPDAASLNLTGNMTLIARIKFDSYETGSSQRIISKWLFADTGSYLLSVAPTGELSLGLVDSSTGIATVSSTAKINTLVDDGEACWLIGSVNPSTGVTYFGVSTKDTNSYTDLTMEDITQLGDIGSFGGAVSVKVGAQDVQIGGRNTTKIENPTGYIYRVIIASGFISVPLTEVLDVDFTAQDAGTTSFTDETGNHTVTINPLATTSNDPKWLEYTDTKYAYLPGVSGNYLSIPDSAALDITGDIDIRAKVALDDWTPASNESVAAKWDSGSTKSWLLQVDTSGNLRLVWSEDGSSNDGDETSSVATGFTDGTAHWVRVTLDVDNGSSDAEVKFYTSEDGSDWTQLGTTQMHGSTTSIYSSSSAMEIGGYLSGVNAMLAGKVYAAQLYDGIDDTLVLDVDVDRDGATGSSPSFTAGTSQTVTVNRSASGRKTVTIDRSVILFGTDDYLQHPDDDFFDFDGSQDFSIVGAGRRWGSSPLGLIGTANHLAYSGWTLSSYSGFGVGAVASAVTQSTATSPAITTGAVTAIGMVRDAGTSLTVYADGVAGTPVTTNPSLDSSVAAPVRIGASNGTTTYADQEWFGVKLYKKVLTAKGVELLSTFFLDNSSGAALTSFADTFNRSNAPLGNRWIDLGTIFPEYLKLTDPGEATYESSKNVQFNELATQLTECGAISEGNLTLSGAKSAGSSGDTTSVATEDGMRVTVWQQTDATENGIYIANHSGAWTRATDFDESSEMEQYTWWFAIEAYTLGVPIRRKFVLYNDNPTIGVDDVDIDFAENWGYRPSYIYENAFASDPNITNKPVGQWSSVAAYRPILDDNFEITVRALYGTGDNLLTFTSQAAPATFINPFATSSDEYGLVFTDDIGIAGSGVIPMYFSRLRNAGVTQASQITGERGSMWMNYPVPSINTELASEIDFIVRVVGGKMAGYIRPTSTRVLQRVVGPMNVPDWASGRKGQGLWACLIPTALQVDQELPNTRVFDSFSVNSYTTALGDAPDAASIESTSTLVTESSQSTIEVSLPTTETGDQIFLVTVSDTAGTFDGFQQPTGWTKRFTGSGKTDNMNIQLWVRGDLADSDESGDSVSLQFAGLFGNKNFNEAHAFTFAVRNGNENARGNGSMQANATASTTITAPDQTLWHENALVLWFGGVGGDTTITAPSGFTEFKEVDTANISAKFFYRVMDADTDNGIFSAEDVYGTTGLIGTLGGSFKSVGGSMYFFHDPR